MTVRCMKSSGRWVNVASAHPYNRSRGLFRVARQAVGADRCFEEIAQAVREGGRLAGAVGALAQRVAARGERVAPESERPARGRRVAVGQRFPGLQLEALEGRERSLSRADGGFRDGLVEHGVLVSRLREVIGAILLETLLPRRGWRRGRR